jgi:hypothetical protein
MILVVPQSGFSRVERLLKKMDEPYYHVGHIAKQRRGRGQVEYL